MKDRLLCFPNTLLISASFKVILDTIILKENGIAIVCKIKNFILDSNINTCFICSTSDHSR